MNTAFNSAVHKGVSKGRVAIAALLVLALAMAWSAAGAKASTAGDDFAVDFNYVGLYVGVTMLDDPIDSLVLTPETDDGAGNLLGALKMKGKYDDASGNFTLPKATGLEFPPVKIDLDIAEIDGEISLAEDAKGNYDPATGKLSLSPKLTLILGTDKIENLPPPVGSIGTGPLRCEFSPLDVKLSTENGWPHPGKVFEDAANLTDGAVAGAWTTKPKVKTIEGGSLCPTIGGMLTAVGGVWLGNSTTPITAMPPATQPIPPADKCAANQTGTPPSCKDKVDPCPEGTSGTPPDCVTDPVPVAKITKVAIKAGKTIKAGKKLKIKVRVTNSGDAAANGVKIALKSSNKQVKLPKSVKISVAAGSTATKTITLKASKKAKGKAKVTAKASGKTGKATVKVKAAKKKK